jgi:hypothetical protein
MSTPTVADARGSRNWTSRRTPGKAFNAGKTLTDIAWLLPTNFERSRWITSDGVDYGPAIHRWSVITGRPAPAPTEPGARGNRRLTPQFVEWLMGCADGWVTDLDLPRAQQLKILGNGVVTRQAIEGYRRLLCADLDAMATAA